jgi:hypothetical protein
VKKVVHVGVLEKNWEQFHFTQTTDGVGRQVGEEPPEFKIQVCRSPPLALTSESVLQYDFVEMSMSPIPMYTLGRKRSRQES